ncbi:hypothetical protein [Streptomyces hirsutus]
MPVPVRGPGARTSYAVVLVALAAAGAGATWGLGRAWARLPFVGRNRWLL